MEAKRKYSENNCPPVHFTNRMRFQKQQKFEISWMRRQRRSVSVACYNRATGKVTEKSLMKATKVRLSLRSTFSHALNAWHWSVHAWMSVSFPCALWVPLLFITTQPWKETTRMNETKWHFLQSLQGKLQPTGQLKRETLYTLRWLKLRRAVLTYFS